jgi:Undecaprenyl-phosphate galactose phosphotransferase WbaP
LQQRLRAGGGVGRRLLKYGVRDDMTSPDSSLKSPAPALVARQRHAQYRKVNWWLVAGDGFGIILAWTLSFGLLWLVEGKSWRQGLIGWWSTLGEKRIALFAGLLLLALLALGVRGHYSRRRPFSDEILDIAKVFSVVVVLDAVFAYLTKWQFSRSWFIAAWLLSFVLVPVTRAAVKLVLMRMRLWQRPTVILGSGRNAREAAAALESEPLMGLEMIAFLAPPDDNSPDDMFEVKGKRIRVLPLGGDPEATLDKLGSPHLIVALEAESLLPHQGLLQRLSARYSDMSIIPPLRGLPFYGMEMTHFFSHEVLMLTVRNNLARPGPRAVKRTFDLIGSAVLLLLLAPVLTFFSWRIRRTDGDAIFGHLRIGQYGKPFRCLKFRTMVPDADKVLADVLACDPEARTEWQNGFKLKNDPRITPIGAFLRATSLDELPQLWNVLKGEMSLVGPRPIIEEELDRYGDQVGYYLEAPPGMTGLWQISGRNDTGYEDRVALDSWYVRNWSLWYDLVIMIKTVRVVLARKGAY